ncbi:MAG: hypothetical protein NDJ89_06070 [Oligoflexia bacterium]|nr:hypothetical protein [Oligoflexia bacterium]
MRALLLAGMLTFPGVHRAQAGLPVPPAPGIPVLNRCKTSFEELLKAPVFQRFGLGENFSAAQDKILIARGEVLALTERRLERNPTHSRLQIHEHRVSPLVLLDAKTEARISDWHSILEKVDQKLGELGDSLVDKKANFPNFGLSSDSKTVALQVLTGSGPRVVLFDYGKGEVRQVFRPLLNRQTPAVRLQHDRYILLTDRAEGGSVNLILDTQTGSQKILEGSRYADISVSPDGERLLALIGDTLWYGRLDQLGSREVIEDAASLKSLKGKLVSQSPDLSQLVVNHGEQTWDPATQTSFHLPVLKVATWKGNSYREQFLPGLENLSLKFKEAKNAGMELLRADVQGKQTPDGHYLAVRFPMRAKTETLPKRGFRQEVVAEYDIVGLWDLRKPGSPPAFTASRDLNSPGNYEPTLDSAIASAQAGETVLRKVAFELSDDGKLTLVRVTSADSNPASPQRAFPKLDFAVSEIRLVGNGQVERSLDAQSFPLKTLGEGDNPGAPLLWGSIDVSADGKRVVAHTRNEGILYFERERGGLSTAGPDPIHPASGVTEKTGKGQFAEILKKVPASFKQTHLTHEDREKIQAIFSMGNLSRSDQLRNAFEAYREARLRGLGRKEREQVLKMLKELRVKKSPSGSGYMRANASGIVMPEELHGTAAHYGVLSHELEHLIQIVEATPSASPAELRRLYGHLTQEHAQVNLWEIGASKGEWEFLSVVPASIRSEAEQSAQQNLGDHGLRLAVTEILQSAGGSLQDHIARKINLGILRMPLDRDLTSLESSVPSGRVISQ